MTEKDRKLILDGKTIDYTYEGGWRFKVLFYNGLAAYQFLGDDGETVSNSNEDIPYNSRIIRDDLYHVVWHEKNIGDLVSLVIDTEKNRIHSAALLDYRGSKPILHFESGDIHDFSDE
ncbi:MAG: hypothetical protein DWQ10_08365 [Calditrichaeota bacterium]|nr:MAG: hypothetical protein DWQ10_08365 [Calditrichota bacterium]